MKKVLLIDSGSGGLNVLKECVKAAPFCDFLLFCDDKNIPYGNKSNEELLKITFENLKNISSFFDFDIVIFACNTLSSVCLTACREKYPNKIFIGTEPAIKPARKKYLPKDILVLATQSTLRNSKVLKNFYGQTLAISTLAADIDQNLDNLSVLKDQIAQRFSNIKCKAVVLGCTHYCAVEEYIKSGLKSKVEFFDGRFGVARRLKSFVIDDSENFQVQIMTSKSQEFLVKLWSRYWS